MDFSLIAKCWRNFYKIFQERKAMEKDEGKVTLSNSLKSEECFPVLIVGWDFTDMGPVWLCRDLVSGGSDFPVLFGSQNIESTIEYPKADMKRICWLHEPFVGFGLKHDFIQDKGWMEENIIETKCDPEVLGEYLTDMDVSNLTNSDTEKKWYKIIDSVLQNSGRHAFLKSLTHDKETNTFTLTHELDERF